MPKRRRRLRPSRGPNKPDSKQLRTTKLKADAEARQRAEADDRAQTAAAEAKDRADVDAKLKSDAESRQKADAEAQKAAAEAKQKAEAAAQKAATEAQQKADADAKLKVDAEAKQKAEAAALAQKTAADAQQKAEAASKLKAEGEAKQKADAEAAEKLAAEIAETGLRLGPNDRQRIQVALTSLGFDTQGVDGVFGPRSRAMIQAWQQARNNPATGFLTAPQQQALLGQATSALAKFDDDQKKKAEAATKAAEAAAKAAEAEAKAADEAARAAPPPPNPSTPPTSSRSGNSGPSVFFGLGSSGHGGPSIGFGVPLGSGGNSTSNSHSSGGGDQAYCNQLSYLYRKYEMNSPGRRFDTSAAVALEDCKGAIPPPPYRCWKTYCAQMGLRCQAGDAAA